MRIQPTNVALSALRNLVRASKDAPSKTNGTLSDYLVQGRNTSKSRARLTSPSFVKQLASPLGEANRPILNVGQSNTEATALHSLSADAQQSDSKSTISDANGMLRTVAEGANSSQVLEVSATSLGANRAISLQGRVTRTPQAAKLILEGGSNGVVASSGEYELSGNRGSVALSLSAGESLDDVAVRVNQHASSTGVSAGVVGNKLILTSEQVGSRATVRLSPLNATSDQVVANAGQVFSINTVQQAAGTTEQITGSVTSSASEAQLVYYGTTNGTVAGTASFRLTGSRGSTVVSLTEGESLDDVADRINQQTTSIGAVATVDGNNIRLSSDSVGAAATVQFDAVDRGTTVTTDGANSAEISSITTLSMEAGTTVVLNGEVVQSATAASVALQGTVGGTVIDTATFNLTGSLGTASLSITQGETLESVANRVNALTNSTGVQAQVSSDQLIFQSTDVGSAANVAIELTDLSHSNVATGVDSSQLSSFQIQSLTTGASETLSGTVDQSAAAASVILQGNVDGTVIDTATFNLTGSLGTASLSITQGETLESVASRINALTNSTGVQAQVSSDQLVFQSTDVGSAATVAVELTDVSHTNVATGVDPSQLSSFQIQSLTTGASETLSGTVNQTAGQGELTFTGALGLVGSSSTFTLSGSLGSAQITTSALQTLSNLASQVNSSTSTTGVSASVSGNTLTLSTVDVGSNATIGVAVTSGSFNVDGGNGDGTANGTDAEATINGESITGTGNAFTFSSASGTYSFSTVAGYTGVINSISVESQPGQFSIVGGNGDGTANGTDAEATINGQSITGTGNAFTFSGAVGSYSFSTVAGYTGAISSISIESQPGQFSIVGGNGDGTANGTDVQANVNGQLLTGTGNIVLASDSGSQFQIDFAEGFSGSFAPVTVQSSLADFDIQGGDGDGVAHGTDFSANINGTSFTNTSNHAVIVGDHGTYYLQFVDGFQGALDPISVTKSNRANIVGGDLSDSAYGTDGLATVNGTQRTGDGATFTFSENDAQVAIRFHDRFSGKFDPITITEQDQATPDSPADPDSPTDPTGVIASQVAVSQNSQSLSQKEIQLLQMQITRHFVQNLLDGFPAAGNIDPGDDAATFGLLNKYDTGYNKDQPSSATSLIRALNGTQKFGIPTVNQQVQAGGGLDSHVDRDDGT
jgi:Flagellin hook IN motif